MAELSETPSGERIRLAFFGKRNAGKSTLLNAVAGQEVAIVSDRPGTTTDPVSKAMEIAPLGPCLLTDTAGLDDDDGALGAQRVAKARAVLAMTDVAIVVTAGEEPGALEQAVLDDCAARGVPAIVYRRGDSVAELKEKIAHLAPAETSLPLVADFAKEGDVVACVCPIDAAAPKGRLILPQQRVIRELLDAGCVAWTCQPAQLKDFSGAAVITDSQAFAEVKKIVKPGTPLTSFSILFARAKGDLARFAAGAEAARVLKDGDRVLVAEGCTHKRQCGDIGTAKIPAAVRKLCGGKNVSFDFVSGGDFAGAGLSRYALVVHCGGCMLTRRTVLARLDAAAAAGVPVVNYGILLAAAAGIRLDEKRLPFTA